MTASRRGLPRDSGFSFVELLAYMAIAALLILAAIPQFEHHRTRAYISTMQSDVRALAAGIESEYDDGYPDTVRNDGKRVLNAGGARLSEAACYVHYRPLATSFQLTLECARTAGYAVNYDSATGGLYPKVNGYMLVLT